jgi:hypothetical protein
MLLQLTEKRMKGKSKKELALANSEGNERNNLQDDIKSGIEL